MKVFFNPNFVHKVLPELHSVCDCRFVPLSQSFPLQPAGHWHCPVTWWHEAPCTHWHLSSQPAPNRPGAHAEQRRCKLEVIINKNTHYSQSSSFHSAAWGHSVCRLLCRYRLAASPLSQSSPTQPALQLHRPVCLSHWPPFSHSHCCWQSAPNQPATHSVYTYSSVHKHKRQKADTSWCEPHTTGKKPVLSYFCWGLQHGFFFSFSPNNLWLDTVWSWQPEVAAAEFGGWRHSSDRIKGFPVTKRRPGLAQCDRRRL